MLRISVAVLLWAVWLCAMVGIVAGIVDNWRDYPGELQMLAVGPMVFFLYCAGALIGVQAFKTLWPKEERRRPTPDRNAKR